MVGWTVDLEGKPRSVDRDLCAGDNRRGTEPKQANDWNFRFILFYFFLFFFVHLHTAEFSIC